MIGNRGLVESERNVITQTWDLPRSIDRGVRSAIFGVSSYDPLTLMATGALLLALAALASLLPALRITRIQPAAVLRAE